MWVKAYLPLPGASVPSLRVTSNNLRSEVFQLLVPFHIRLYDLVHFHDSGFITVRVKLGDANRLRRFRLSGGREERPRTGAARQAHPETAAARHITV